MIHEWRVYTCVPGRLPALLERFEKTTLPIMARHGLRPLGFWTTIIGESNQRLQYILAWESLAEREEMWHAFHVDPEWVAKRQESEKNGPLIASIKNEILQPTRFSAIK
jgi:NIPSNAP